MTHATSAAAGSVVFPAPVGPWHGKKKNAYVVQNRERGNPHSKPSASVPSSWSICSPKSRWRLAIKKIARRGGDDPLSPSIPLSAAYLEPFLVFFKKGTDKLSDSVQACFMRGSKQKIWGLRLCLSVTGTSW